MWIEAASAVTFGNRPAGVDTTLRLASYAVILDGEGRVAAVSVNVRGQSMLWLPGGGRNGNETPEQTIEREVREELGCGVQVLQWIGDATQFFFAADEDRWYEIHARFYLAELTNQADSSGEYILQWIDSQTQQHRFFHACHTWACQRAFDNYER